MIPQGRPRHQDRVKTDRRGSVAHPLGEIAAVIGGLECCVSHGSVGTVGWCFGLFVAVPPLRQR